MRCVSVPTLWAAAVLAFVGCSDPSRPSDAHVDGHDFDALLVHDGDSDGASSETATDVSSASDGDVAEDTGCAAGESFCAGSCIGTQSDVHHCGGCDTDCTMLAGVVADSVHCVAGVCDVTNACLSGRAHCSTNPLEGCETDITTAFHCGACETRCSGSTPICVRAGGALQCGSACSPSAPMLCGSSCVDLQSDLANCGGCGVTCDSAYRAPARCEAGACLRECVSGSANCDGSWSDGCEVDTATDVNHCGGCSTVCGGGANATAMCRAGMCALVCSAGFGDCNGEAIDGCETRLATDVANCGACGTACPVPANSSPTCTAGACGFVCNAGYVRCGSMCVAVDDPAYGCGSCAPCPMALHSTGSRCTTSGCAVSGCATGYKSCSTTCESIFDPAHGCIAMSCSPCALAPNATTMTCTSTGLCAPSACAAGYKLCGGGCTRIAPSNGCSAAGCGTACAVQNASAICNASGSCDYSACAPGFFDFDGNRANGCETAGPATISGLRVWFDAGNAASLHTVPCAGGTCVTRWDNLADAANPAVNSDTTTMPYVAPGSYGGVLFDESYGAGLFYIPDGDAAFDHLDVGLAFMIGSAYTIYAIAIPQWATDSATGNNYVLGCAPSGPFATNGAFHFGWVNASVLRLAHYSNDLDTPWGSADHLNLLGGSFDFATQTLTAEDLSVTGLTARASRPTTGALNAASNCAIGRGPASDQRFRGRIFEIVVYNRALTVSEHGVVANYMRTHW